MLRETIYIGRTERPSFIRHPVDHCTDIPEAALDPRGNTESFTHGKSLLSLNGPESIKAAGMFRTNNSEIMHSQ